MFELQKFKSLKEEKLFFIITNFLFGFTMFLYYNFINSYLELGLWHKILIFGINIPIGLLSGIIISLAFFFFFYMCFVLDLKYYRREN